MTIGDPFPVVHANAIEFLSDLGPDVIMAVNDPPWLGLSPRIATPRQLFHVTSMEHTGLEDMARIADETATCVIGVGGGTAIDTAKFIAWSTGLPAVFVPTIASVDATFTDAVGVRRDRKVTYVGNVRPREVVIDLDLITSAPPRLNRAGIGDILSCHTGLYDWALAVDADLGVPWNANLAELGRNVLVELGAALPDVRAASSAGVSFILDAYRRIGAACSYAGHSRFEEGSEHFLGYALEEATGLHFVHGELIAMCVVAMSVIQDNDPTHVAGLVTDAGTYAHPDSVGITKEVFTANLRRLDQYTRSEGLDYCIVNQSPVTTESAELAWQAVCTLPKAQ